ncbi:hypothetical protein E2605_18005 [Dysgonomonas capnocytophagoides]|uniref:Uncharacterized protein n=1 Tax=Dysgonomonas capnocytophagoides TaxID=45254 RepID=A0A4Y8KXX2_9BACT|nr:hypothetical protein [Dysgonomonas capnocytophagoides]TFD93008.1 hypothetical protein E2605_18005 [Dysgonomonas capnocytophagoides]
MIYILILQNPLRVQPYSSLTALFEDNGTEVLQSSLSKLQKWDWRFNYIAHNVVISKRETLSTGDVRRNKKDSDK